MRISYSAATTWRACQQRYHYSYIDGLRPKVEKTAPTMGRVLHGYLEAFHQTRMDKPKMNSRKAHGHALEVNNDRWREELEGLSFAAYAAGEDETGREMSEMLDKAARISQRYFDNRGRVDWDKYNVLATEVKLEYTLTRGIITPLVIDLITEDADGRIDVWEHKTGKDAPPQRRLKDLQTVLYAAVAEEVYGIEVRGVVWNYMRTKEPTVPEVLRAGKTKGEMTRRRDLDNTTTWATYAQALTDAGLDIADYDDMNTRLIDNETTAFFQRYEMPIMQSEDVVLRDLITTASTIKAVYESGTTVTPVRNISRDCDWCQFAKLCEAAILGFDDSEIAERLFRREERNDSTPDTADTAREQSHAGSVV